MSGLRPIACFLVLSAFALGSVAAPALAQRAHRGAQNAGDAPNVEQARAAFTRAQRAFDSGDYTTALDEFRLAYTLTGAPELLYNIGTSADRLRRDADALASFRAYVREVPGASDRAAVEARIRVLERSVSDADARSEADRRRAEQPAGGGLGRAGPGVDADAGEGGVLTKWWFWTIVGAVVVTGIAVGVAVGSTTELAPPTPGDDGGVIIALRW